MVNTLDSQSRSPGSRVGLAGTICCSLMKFWLGGGGGRGVSSGWMSYLPQVQTESFFLFFFFYLILLTCKRLTKIMAISSVGFSSP